MRAEGALNEPAKKLSEKKSLKKKKGEQAAAAALATAASGAAAHKKAAAAGAMAAAPADGKCVLADTTEDTTSLLQLQSLGVAATAEAISEPADTADDQKRHSKRDQQLQPQQNQQQKGQEDHMQNIKDQEEPQQQQKAAVRFVSLGLSPFHQLKDGEMKHSKSLARWLNRAFEHGTPFYSFKTMAASKAKYGAGLHDGVYKDSSVTYRNTYLCHTHGRKAAVTLYDLGAFVGFYYYPIPALITMLKEKRQQDKARAAMSGNGGR